MLFIEKIPNSPYCGIEFPNIIGHASDYDDAIKELDSNKSITAFHLGKDMFGKSINVDFKELRNILIGGQNAGGKTNLLNNIISTLLKRTSPEQLRLVLMDPTHFEMNIYKDVPHLLCPIVVDPMTCVEVLKSLVETMNDRYNTIEKSHSKNIEEYNAWATKHDRDRMPYVIVILNEYSLFSINVKLHSFHLTTLLQKGYACGIHVIVSTKKAQRYVLPSIVTTNLLTRISFQTDNIFDSVNVLGEAGAEKIMASTGNMLVRTPSVNGNVLTRVDTPYISTETIYKIVKSVIEKYDGIILDDIDIKVESTPVIEEMKNVFLNNDSINNDNQYRVRCWAYDQEYIDISKIQNELGIDEDEANIYLDMLYNEGILMKTDNPFIYKVFED